MTTTLSTTTTLPFTTTTLPQNVTLATVDPAAESQEIDGRHTICV